MSCWQVAHCVFVCWWIAAVQGKVRKVPNEHVLRPASSCVNQSSCAQVNQISGRRSIAWRAVVAVSRWWIVSAISRLWQATSTTTKTTTATASTHQSLALLHFNRQLNSGQLKRDVNRLPDCSSLLSANASWYCSLIVANLEIMLGGFCLKGKKSHYS